MRRIVSPKPLNTNLAALLLRVLLGGLFVRYGFMKASAYNEILPLFQDVIGIGARLSFNLVIFAELVCGFFVLVGLLTRLTIIPIFVTMAVAFFVAHKNDSFDLKAIVLVYLLMAMIVFIMGSGKYSIDALLFKRKNAIIGRKEYLPQP
jgi:putative oxidoreductase